MISPLQAPVANASLEELENFYHGVRSQMQHDPHGEPANTGKTVDDLVGRAARFASEGTILNVVSRAKVLEQGS